jgi:hypothetical protein
VPLEMAAAGAGTGSEGKKRGASRSWILLDAAGEEQLLDADKYAIMRRVDINARDLRILDPLLSYPSTILGRERAIVLNLEVPLPSPIPSAFASSIVSFFVRWVAWEEESRSSVCGAGFLRFLNFAFPLRIFGWYALFVARYGAAC